MAPIREGQLERIDSKLDAIREAISQIKANQAADLERFAAIHLEFAESVKDRAKDLKLHAADCELRKKLEKIEKNFDAASNQAKGAWWVSGRLWAAVAAIFFVVDIVVRTGQALGIGGMKP